MCAFIVNILYICKEVIMPDMSSSLPQHQAPLDARLHLLCQMLDVGLKQREKPHIICDKSEVF